MIISSLPSGSARKPSPELMLHLTLEGAKNDVINVYTADNERLEHIEFESEQTSSEIDIVLPAEGEYIFESEIAKALDNSGANYRKTILLTAADDHSIAKIMPDITMYWYGNIVNIENVGATEGVSFQTNQIECDDRSLTTNPRYRQFITKVKLDLSNAKKLFFVGEYYYALASNSTVIACGTSQDSNLIQSWDAATGSSRYAFVSGNNTSLSNIDSISETPLEGFKYLDDCHFWLSSDKNRRYIRCKALYFI